MSAPAAAAALVAPGSPSGFAVARFCTPPNTPSGLTAEFGEVGSAPVA
ncbi:Uncharacterised protein [Mycobacteroides abscessus subsp. abscessus]|nr:Uncharacterised protein [Mycobacteroides abscessus subsp. abscessus]